MVFIFQGPGWDYETELPEWAKFDWVDDASGWWLWNEPLFLSLGHLVSTLSFLKSCKETTPYTEAGSNLQKQSFSAEIANV